MRILYHHRTQGRGAEGNHIVSIVTGMRELGHEVDVLSPPGVDPFNVRATIPVDEAKSGVRGWQRLWKFVSTSMPNWMFELAEMFYNLPAHFRLRRALRAARYDLVFERYATYLFAGALAARRAGCLFAVEFNDVSGVADRVRPQSFPRLCAAVERRLVARCDLGHAVSSYLGDRLFDIGLPRERLVVAPNGFDVQRIKLSVARADMRARLGFHDAFVVGFAGWFVPWDRLDFMFDVLLRVRAQVPALRLCLVGEGAPARELLARSVGTPLEGAIVVTGAVPRTDVYDYIQAFDLGFLPHSNLFGSPVVMFEMMGLGVPVLAPRLPPIEDVMTDGETASLFKPLDADDCVVRLEALAGDSERRNLLARNASDRLRAAHTWRKTAERILGALPRPNVQDAREVIQG